MMFPSRCVKNCGLRLVAEKRLVLSVECSAECDAAPIAYSWDAVSSDGVVLEGRLDWKKQTTTGGRSSYLVVKSGTFRVDDSIGSMRVTGENKV